MEEKIFKIRWLPKSREKYEMQKSKPCEQIAMAANFLTLLS